MSSVLPKNAPENIVLASTFYCRVRFKQLTYDRCMLDFVDADALQIKDSPCHKCVEGRIYRKRFALS